jgi:hypothetical protein
MESTMTAQEFLDLSTKLCSDMKAWVAEGGKDNALSLDDLATLTAATQIVERVTLGEAEVKSSATRSS